MLLLTFFAAIFLTASGQERKPPHIIFILADDMGWNDVSFHGSPQIPTPNIDALAASGIVLNSYYAAPQCTPSRGSLLTGKYAIHLGLQHFVINSAEPTGLPLDIKVMPQYLKELGYATHLIGKWHLGYYKKEFTPTHRGFDSFFGYWNGLIDYYDYTNYESTNIPGIKAMWGIDLHNGTDIIKNFRGRYATDVFTEKALNIIAQHNESEPLFLYLSHLACHTGSQFQPMQAPPDHVAKFKHIEDLNRRTYAGIVSKIDESVGKLFEGLNAKGMLDNTIIVFSSDNGGEAEGERGGHASNWPLRSMKLRLWEGAVRVSAVIWSNLLQLQEPIVSTQLMHITDWLPTFYSAAGGDIQDLGEIDGLNMWEHLRNGSPSPRQEILLNIDPIYNMSAIRQGDYKLVFGTFPGDQDSWYGPSGLENPTVRSMDGWVWKDGSVVKDILEESGRWLVKVPDEWRSNLMVECGPSQFRRVVPCDPRKAPCLFNIELDPCEYEDLAQQYPEIVQSLMDRIKEYNETARVALSEPLDPKGDPRCHGFAYVSWRDEEHESECPYL